MNLVEKFIIFRRDDIYNQYLNLNNSPIESQLPREAELLLEAIKTVSHSAKRYRDNASEMYFRRYHSLAKAAKSQKELLYHVKDRGIEAAYSKGFLKPVCVQGDWVVWEGGGYSFHSGLAPLNIQLPYYEELVYKEKTNHRKMTNRKAIQIIYKHYDKLPGQILYKNDGESCYAVVIKQKTALR